MTDTLPAETATPDRLREEVRLLGSVLGDVIREAGVTVDIVDVAVGFPVAYPGLTPPPLEDYMLEIEAAFN